MSLPLDPSPLPPNPLPPSPFLNRLIRFLLPFFIGECPDLDAARAEILETLASYGARTRSELLNAAQIIAYGLTALDVLHEAKTTEMSPSARLRHRSCANGLNRSGQQNEKALAKRLASDPPKAETPPQEPFDDITDAQIDEQLQEVHRIFAARGLKVPTLPEPNFPPVANHAIIQPAAHHPAGP